MITETEFLLDLADQHERIRGVVGWVPLCERAGEPFLERFAAHSRLVGVRHVVHDEPDDDFILRPDFNEGVRRLERYGLTYDILIFAKHLPQTICFVDQHPNQPFIVDHVAKPTIASGAFDAGWAAAIRDLARREHVACKLSGMVTEVRDPAWDPDLLRPYFETVFDAFGPDRLMFGSDWPVCLLRSSYADWTGAARNLAADLGTDERTALFGHTASRLYGLSPVASGS
jgi:L-fuconolactonase